MRRISTPVLAIVAAFSVFGASVQAACPNDRCQERSDVVFRDLGSFLRGLIEEHSGVYMSYTGNGDPAMFSNHSVMEMDGPGGVRVISLQRFVDDASTSLGYEGAHTAKGFVVPIAVRDAIAEFANLHRDLAYVAGSGEEGVAASMIIRYNGEPPLTPGQIEGIRSDGWVEYVYARAGIKIQGDIIGNPDYYNRTFTLLGKTLTELSPKTQRLAMEPTTIGDPSEVGRLRSPTHAPNNTCRKSPLRMEWDAATDVLSGVAQYFARVDKSATTIPDATDLPSIAGNVVEKEFILSSGKDYRVHVRSVDRAGNWDAHDQGGELVTEHQGPFCIDNDKPTARVLDAAGNQVADGGVTSGNITVVVNDRVGTGAAAEAFSGPGRLEVWKGDPNSGGTLLASNDDDFAEQHTYTSADTGLSVLGNLPEGQIVVRAFDQAENEDTRVSFQVQSQSGPTVTGLPPNRSMKLGKYLEDLGACEESGGTVAKAIIVPPAPAGGASPNTSDPSGMPGSITLAYPEPGRCLTTPFRASIVGQWTFSYCNESSACTTISINVTPEPQVAILFVPGQIPIVSDPLTVDDFACNGSSQRWELHGDQIEPDEPGKTLAQRCDSSLILSPGSPVNFGDGTCHWTKPLQPIPDSLSDDGQRGVNYLADIENPSDAPRSGAIHFMSKRNTSSSFFQCESLLNANLSLAPGQSAGAKLAVPLVGQKISDCTEGGDACLKATLLLPKMSCRPITEEERFAEQTAGLARLNKRICTLNPSPAAFLEPVTLDMQCLDPPPGAVNAGCRRQSASGGWGSAVNAFRDGGRCACDLATASDWAIFADIVGTLPDATKPTVSAAEVSNDGASWLSPSTLLAGPSGHARAQVRDNPFPREESSGLTLSTAPLAPASVPGTLALLHLDEGSGSFSEDASGHGARADWAGRVVSWTPGRFGQALQFHLGHDSFADVAAAVPERFTLSFWIKASDPKLQAMASDRNGSGGALFSIQNFAPSLTIYSGGSGFQITGSAVSPNEWHHILGTFDGTHASLFVDGQQAGRIPVAHGPGGGLLLGRDAIDPGQFAGSLAIDEVRVLDRAVSRAEAAAEYRRGYWVQLSTDGGSSFRAVAESSIGFPATPGSPGPVFLTASNLALAQSDTANVVSFLAYDAAGNGSELQAVLRVPPPDTLALTVSEAEVSNDGSSWFAQGSLLPGATVQFRAKVRDPPAPPAGLSGVRVSTSPAAPALVPGTLALLRFDEGSGSIAGDGSGKGKHGQIEGPATWVDGRFGKALRFVTPDQVENFVTMPPLEAERFTISLWVKVESDRTQAIFSNLTGSAAQRRGVLAGVGALKPFCNLEDGNNTGQSLTGDRPLEPNVWHHFVCAFDGTHGALYVDGELLARRPSGFQSSDGTFRIGQGVVIALRGTLWVDEFRFVNRALAEDEILLDFRRGYQVLYSADTGATWRQAEASLDGAVDGAPGPFTLRTAGLSFAESETSNSLRVLLEDMAGNRSSTVFPIPIGQDSVPPGAPSLISASRAGGRVELAWTPAPGEAVASYELYRSTEPIGSIVGTAPLAAGLRATTYMDTPAEDGTYHYAVAALDAQGNRGLSANVEGLSDRAPPVTAASFTPPAEFDEQGRATVAPGAAIGFSAADPLAGGAASGVAVTRYLVDGDTTSATFAVFGSTFTLAIGPHVLAWRSEDRAGNVEAVKTLSLVVEQPDRAAPVTTLLVQGDRYLDGAREYASARSRFDLRAVDLGTGSSPPSGVDRTEYRLDEIGGFNAFAEPFGLAEGERVIEFRSSDKAGNLEVASSSRVAVDATAPISSLEFAGPYLAVASGTIVSPLTAVRIAAQDPVSAAVAAGVARVEAGIDGAPLAEVTTGFYLPEGRHLAAFRAVDNVDNAEPQRLAAIDSDATAPRTRLLANGAYYEAGGERYAGPTLEYRLQAEDPIAEGVASGLAFTRGRLDGAAFSLSTSPFTLAEGRRLIEFQSADRVENLEPLQSESVLVDATPPATTATIEGPQWPLADATLISTASAVALATVDVASAGVASGVRETLYRLGGGALVSYAGPIRLAAPDRDELLEFHGVDHVGNTESPKALSLRLDSTAPSVALLAPAGSGICSVVQGTVTVRAAVSDAHLAQWRLESAPGKDASSGFSLIGTGTTGGESSASWSPAPGWNTLRLSAVDRVGNFAQTRINVFSGEPAVAMVVGSPEVFDLPEAVAVGPDGKVYVADRNGDRIAIFTADGEPAGELGSREPKSPARLHKPSGVAVDSLSRVYVADTGNDRVARFDGPAVGLELKTLKGPEGVAVGSDGRIYASDTGSGRIAVFSSTGAMIAAYQLPPPHPGRGGDDGTGKPRPAGLAAGAAGGLYVAVPKAGQVLKLDSQGAVVSALQAGEKGEPHGVAVAPEGRCVALSDMKLARLALFDEAGAPLSSFGAKGNGRREELEFKKPMGVAMGPDGALWVADRNNGRVLKLGAPTGTAVVVASAAVDKDSAREIVAKEEGAEVLRRDKAGVLIPAEALSEDLKIVVGKPEEDRARAEAASSKGLAPLSPPVEYGPHGTSFAKPVTLVLPVVSKADASAKVHYWNPKTGHWEALASAVDASKKAATAQTTHFSIYQVLAEGGAAPAALADPSFALRDHYVFPNPAKGGEKPAIHLAVGLADSVVWKVFDVAGREVHRASLSSPKIIDDGSGPRYAYEAVWEGRIASGFYFYQVEAEKGGKPKIRAAGKFGVVR